PNAAFERYLAQGRPAYEGKYRLPADRAISAIRGAGGLAVLAHPSSLDMDNASLEGLVARLAEMGLSGVEAYYPGHSPAMTKKFTRMAHQAGLFVTGGTDFHGGHKPSVAMGSGKGDLFVPFSVYEEMARAYARQAARP
ncbi:MAG: PHP domain-containing protein, partial [Proteobacteria bacterium]|nr:PHP domain-containing protein [Pseudomonadota bacterium]